MTKEELEEIKKHIDYCNKENYKSIHDCWIENLYEELIKYKEILDKIKEYCSNINF